MTSKGQSVGHESSHKYAEKKVSSISGAMVSCSKKLQSDTGFSITELDCLHDSNTNASSLKPSTSSNVKEKSNLHNSMKIKVAMDGMIGAEKFSSRPNQFSSSPNFLSQPSGYVNKFQAPKHSYGKFSFRDAKDYHISAKIPSPSNHSWDKKINGNSETSIELVRGPRANRIHFPSSAEKNELGPLVSRDQFNKKNFQIKYEHAKFFMIKSYSEDDIQKSIKYSVWASTPYGNKKLDDAFKDAQAAVNEMAPKCPVFLFFSVNASGQFVGLAEMIGPVDFNKSMEFWQKKGNWNGFFPVKWHMIKDIPNKYFQTITLENNDNKPVTFSRDTQEIGLPQGLKMLQFFKGYPLARSLLDDYDFYEQREKSLNDQRSQQQLSQTEVYMDNDMFPGHLEAEFGEMSISRSERLSYGSEF